MAKNWVIAIGINEYDNLKPLKYAKKDAEAIKAWCEGEGGFDRSGIFLFTEDSPPIPASPPIPTQLTHGRLKRFLQRQFETPLLKSGDNLWFFFAGHGRRYQDKDYLMLPDSDPGNVRETAVSVDYVTERLRRSGADNVVLLLDACRDEDSRGGLGIGEEEHQGVITFYSCTANQQSWEIDELQQGSFTHTLLEGLRRQGEANCATVERLDEHLRRQVEQTNARYGKPRQNPYLKAEPPHKLYFILLEQVATLRDVQPLKYQASLAENRGDLDLAEQLWIRVLGASRGDLDAIEAIKRIALRQSSIPFMRREYVTGSEGNRSSSPKPSQETGLKVFNFEVVRVNAKGEQIKKESKQSQYFSEDLGNGITLEMVAIPGGTFLMGTEDEEIERLAKKFNWDGFRSERPQHRVTVSSFYMGRYPITQSQWKAIASRTDLKVKQDLDFNPAYFKDRPDSDRRPVEQVNWYDAIEFCARLSKLTVREYRLPSEAEWEYACRAGTTTPFYFGETITGELANYRASNTYAEEAKGEFREETTPVGQFPPNAFGLHDMHGNVWEWCADTWHDNYDGAPRDGSVWRENGNDNRSPLRGGSWCSDPDCCRSAYRSDFIRRDFISDSGFRVVCGAGRTL
ncbi:MAG: SUMF1/EgtB/PvdO family nonheme iron enzyme [Microcystis sp. M54BS1]|uniref:SUMF1/EgtB/PvdO family nonheme iron enzyme n=1 Tax=unclassified Microcystis TaxID=2643300 RepID=UPI00257B2098|nr:MULTISPECIES: SUMF1/EgtB/PvdO family nonheme iron enzyme [unclassified Microcystis]MCA2537968.1 SUMF1/EgtB/PvdO family nonheme iron enzyme [Microcystis sp. M54BS1]MCA2598023.1 SUMF1/EgtB/PvdO family nonheme iron enzyme [Microcystis sp. M38BS1]MCA2612932.1 SUMF1/EgtB/PvdO family nonheme iron enzyme [Microcystis sp. M27BS1]MCA2506843.1 SUMF1/EgtB/PvdO family nonheme iron enzyme [Microcystis sp. M62BS1]MCA2509438.1 SUMF1/EgtB/PvdO family nonheme iron enzyme [Microcystis sp. M60BS1]